MAKVKKENKKASTKLSFTKRHHVLHIIMLAITVLIGVIVVTILAGKLQTAWRQHKLDPFYDTKGLALEGSPGEIVRQEAMKEAVPNGSGTRILYRTQRADGSSTFSSGMIFIPDGSSNTRRPIVAWAHGTVGFGEACAPSRIPKPADSIAGLGEMLANGWVVVATDYAGLGTPGTQGYLVGDAEARDVLNSIRAASSLPQASAGNVFTIWGHSQGGHSALFTASEAQEYAPELELKGTVASAPAAELVPLLNEQYGTAADWVIGPLIAISWPANNSALNANDIMTSLGQKTYQKIAPQCIKQSALAGIVRNAVGQKFLSTNPTDIPEWKEMALQESGPILEPNQPLMVVESLADKVVLPNTTALYIQTACNDNSNLQSLWLEKAGHLAIPKDSYPQVVSWLSDRFDNLPNESSCNESLPIAPATP